MKENRHTARTMLQNEMSAVINSNHIKQNVWSENIVIVTSLKTPPVARPKNTCPAMPEFSFVTAVHLARYHRPSAKPLIVKMHKAMANEPLATQDLSVYCAARPGRPTKQAIHTCGFARVTRSGPPLKQKSNAPAAPNDAAAIQPTRNLFDPARQDQRF